MFEVEGGGKFRPKLRLKAGMLNYSLLLAVHFLVAVPLHAARSLWIATRLKLHPDVVSKLSCYDAVDLEKLVKSMEKPVVADR